MIKAVPFLTREQIEDQASDLLLAYGAKYGVVSKPPIPADEIMNTHLKLKFDFDNLSRLLRVDADVFGAHVRFSSQFRVGASRFQATGLSWSRVREASIQMLLGHRSLRTTQHYTYVSTATVSAAPSPLEFLALSVEDKEPS